MRAATYKIGIVCLHILQNGHESMRAANYEVGIVFTFYTFGRIDMNVCGPPTTKSGYIFSSGDLLWNVSLAALQCCKTTVGGPHVKIAPMCATLSGSDHSHAVWGLRQIFKPILHQESKKFVLKSFPRMMFGKITFFLCYCSLGTVQKSLKCFKKILSELVMISSIFQWTISQNEEHD